LDKTITRREMMNYKLTIHPAMEAGEFWTIFRFETEAELNAARHTAADLLLFIQDKAMVMDDYSNMFISEALVDGEWEEIGENEEDDAN
jgi:hypothetical protein